ncbi:hypothetical protein PIB30_059769 [Stylosanthes scabra]|uniref:RRM domain-containing protein n=1 Tax=Stylosanthes scabra TaxID=79078 RepID=A0ABU6QKT5_9FABA|nr:hypothetical protein [Stylosanthes scabra]
MRGAERGKHGEVAGRRNKGESVGGFAQGVWRGKYWDRNRYDRDQTSTIFFDRLSEDVSKRELYKVFGKYGFISEIFISRKWGSKRLLVTISKYRQRVEGDRGRQKELTGVEAKRRITQKWVAKKNNTKEGEPESSRVEKHVVLPQRKTIQAEWDVDQQQRLQRSLLGVCVKPIELRKVMYFLLDEWKGPGDIEVRDVRPYRCLITFSSPKIRDEVVKSELLHSMFDEVRYHWDIFWTLSRRVWIEVIRYDDRAEEAKSFSTARIQIDSFQWEMIHEWFNVSVEDRQFEVFIKEFGSEIYSIQSHPDREEGNSDGSDEGEGDSQRRVSPVRVPSVEVEKTPMIDLNLNLKHVTEPVIETIINRQLNVLREMWDVDVDDYGMSITKQQGQSCFDERRVGDCLRLVLKSLYHDPITNEAHLTLIKKNTEEVVNKTDGLITGSDEHNVHVGSGSNSSCPFPLGFGPCLSVQSEPEETASNCNPNLQRSSLGVECNTVAVPNDEERVEILDERRDGNLLNATYADANKENGNGQECSIGSEERSDETLYQLTEKAIRELADSEELQHGNVDSGLAGDVNW